MRLEHAASALALGTDQRRSDGTRYRVDGRLILEERDRSISLLAADLERPIALWLSTDERHLFAVDGANGKLWRYHLDVMWPGELVATLAS